MEGLTPPDTSLNAEVGSLIILSLISLMTSGRGPASDLGEEVAWTEFLFNMDMDKVNNFIINAFSD
jgi:hypothetical protein